MFARPKLCGIVVVTILALGGSIVSASPNQLVQEWRIKVETLFDPEYCENAALKLKLTTPQGDVVDAISPSVEDDAGYRPETWRVSLPGEGRYLLSTTWVDCQEQTHEAPEIEILALRSDLDRFVLVVPHGNKKRFTVDFIESCARRSGTGILEAEWDSELRITNTSTEILRLARDDDEPSVSVHPLLDDEWGPPSAGYEWPKGLDAISPGATISLELVKRTQVVVGVGQDIPDSMGLEILIQPNEIVYADTGWSERESHPFVLEPCVDTYVVSLPDALASNSEFADVIPDDDYQDIQKMVQTRHDIRYPVALAFHLYAGEHKAYPGPTDGIVPVETVLPEVVPEYMKEAPANDGWGNPIMYVSDGKQFLLLSAGADGKWDHPYEVLLAESENLDEFIEQICNGKQVDLTADHIWADSNHCQWVVDPREKEYGLDYW